MYDNRTLSAFLRILYFWSAIAFSSVYGGQIDREYLPYYVSSSDPWSGYHPSSLAMPLSYGFSGFILDEDFSPPFCGGGLFWLPTPYSNVYFSGATLPGDIRKARMILAREDSPYLAYGFAMGADFIRKTWNGVALEPSLRGTIPILRNKTMGEIKLSTMLTIPLAWTEQKESGEFIADNPARLGLDLQLFRRNGYSFGFIHDQFYSFSQNSMPSMTGVQWGYSGKGKFILKNSFLVNQKYSYIGNLLLRKEFSSFFMEGNYHYYYTGESWHNAQITFGYYYKDTSRPSIEIKESPDVISPDGNGIKDTADFRFRFRDMSKIREWYIGIYDKDDMLVRKYQSGEPWEQDTNVWGFWKNIFRRSSAIGIPEMVTWDGYKKAGSRKEIYEAYGTILENDKRLHVSPDAEYHYEIFARDIYGNQTTIKGSPLFMRASSKWPDLKTSFHGTGITIKINGPAKSVRESFKLEAAIHRPDKTMILRKEWMVSPEQKYGDFTFDFTGVNLYEISFYSVTSSNAAGNSESRIFPIRNEEFISFEYARHKEEINSELWGNIILQKEFVENKIITKVVLAEKIPEKGKIKNPLLEWGLAEFIKEANTDKKEKTVSIPLRISSLQSRKIGDGIFYLLAFSQTDGWMPPKKIWVDTHSSMLSLRAIPDYSIPQEEYIHPGIKFSWKIKDYSPVENVSLSIYQEADEKNTGLREPLLIREYNYTGKIPDSVVWDGISGSGYPPVSFGRYYAILTVNDVWNNKSYVRSKSISYGLSMKKTLTGYEIVMEYPFLDYDTGIKNEPMAHMYYVSLVNALKKYHADKIQISCHTASTGDELENLERSEKNAFALKRALVNSGITTEKISFTGKGEIEPELPEENPYYTRFNERIVVRFIRKNP